MNATRWSNFISMLPGGRLLGIHCERDRSWHPNLKSSFDVDRSRLNETLQQVWSRGTPRIGHETHHPGGAGMDIDMIRLCENGLTGCNVERSGGRAASDNEKPGLSVRF